MSEQDGHLEICSPALSFTNKESHEGDMWQASQGHVLKPSLCMPRTPPPFPVGVSCNILLLDLADRAGPSTHLPLPLATIHLNKSFVEL